MSDLMDFLRQKFKNGAVYKSHLKKSCSKPAWQWLQQAVQKANFSPRKESLSQKIPENWLQASKAGAERVQETFKRNKVTVLINCRKQYLQGWVKSVLVLHAR